MSIRDGLVGYYSSFGLRGVAAISAFRLFAWPKEITAHPAGIREPVDIRVGTSDRDIYAAILLRREYRYDLPFSPKTIVDAGANTGMASIYFTHKYPDAKIIAVEAESTNFEILRRNVRPYPAIIPVHAALWNRDGEITVSEPDPGAGARGKAAFITHEGGGAKRVRAMTMQTLMREMRISLIDLAKIDIEGAEHEVFEDTQWLRGTGCVMIELHDRFRSGCAAAVEPAMRDFVRTEQGETTFYVRRDLMTAAPRGRS